MLITVVTGSIFAYYAFGAPDETDCYASENSRGNYVAYPLPPNKDYNDVGREFHVFFVMGFLLMVS